MSFTGCPATLLNRLPEGNTLILPVKAATLWEIGWSCFPTMMQLFETYRKAIGTPNEKRVSGGHLRGYARSQFLVRVVWNATLRSWQ